MNKIQSLLLASALLACACSLTAKAQTTQATQTTQTTASPNALSPLSIGPLSLDGFTNLPTATNYESVVLSLDVGVVTKNGAVANSIKADYYVATNWMFSVEIQNATVGGVIQNSSVYFGRRLKIWDNAQLDVQGLVRHIWTTESSGDRSGWQGGLSLGATWDVISGGKLKCRIEDRVLSDPVQPFKRAIQNETVVYGTLNL
jgi:hypothetical protein